MMKKIALICVLSMLLCIFAGCSNTSTTPTEAAAQQTEAAASQNGAPAEPAAPTEAEAPAAEANWRVAMITDYGDITDQSFNQTTFEAGNNWCKENNIDFTYYKPTADSTEARVASVDQAVADGYNVLLMPGFAFADTVKETAEANPDVRFIVLDVGEGDYGDYVLPENVYSAVYKEELAGYMAGVAAVKLGYTHLCYLGGMAVPAVIRYGYGFVQGCNAAAEELGIADAVTVEYVYGNQFYGDADITAFMDTIYSIGTEVCFAAGGSIYQSACEAAAKVGGKLIGVDVDQAAIIDADYGEGMTVTSAMKGLYTTVVTALSDLILNNAWDNYAGKVASLGLVSDNPNENYVQIAPSTQYEDGKFTEQDYLDLVGRMYRGEITVSDDITKEPAVSITVNYLGNIK